LDDPNQDVATVAALRVRNERHLSRHQQWVERFTARVGRPRTVYIVAASTAAWTAANVLAPRFGYAAVDPPPFDGLQGVIGFLALLVTTAVLITQSRQTRDFEQRAELELQVNLLAEQKIAKLIALVEELRRDIPSVSDRVDPLAERMKEPIDPHAVLTALEQTMPTTRPEHEGGGSPAPSERG
jgi:uncharacterized membrane protein